MDGFFLIIIGGALEVAGFGLLAADLYRQQSNEFGVPTFVSRVQKILGRQKRIAVGRTLGVSYGIGDIQARGRAREHAASESPEARLVALERNFEHMEHEIDADYSRLRGELKQIRYDLGKSFEDIQRATEEAEQARRGGLRHSLRLQARATGLFLLGTSISIVGGILS